MSSIAAGGSLDRAKEMAGVLLSSENYFRVKSFFFFSRDSRDSWDAWGSWDSWDQWGSWSLDKARTSRGEFQAAKAAQAGSFLGTKAFYMRI